MFWHTRCMAGWLASSLLYLWPPFVLRIFCATLRVEKDGRSCLVAGYHTSHNLQVCGMQKSAEESHITNPGSTPFFPSNTPSPSFKTYFFFAQGDGSAPAFRLADSRILQVLSGMRARGPRQITTLWSEAWWNITWMKSLKFKQLLKSVDESVWGHLDVEPSVQERARLQLFRNHRPQASGPLPVASYPTTTKWELNLGAFHDQYTRPSCRPSCHNLSPKLASHRFVHNP